MDLSLEIEFRKFEKYFQTTLDVPILETKKCAHQLYGKSHPVLLVQSSSSTAHLVYSSHTQITHLEIPTNPDQISPLLTLEQEICFGPSVIIPLTLNISDVTRIVESDLKVGDFIYSHSCLALVWSTTPVKLVLLHETFQSVNSEIMLKIVDSIGRYIVKEVDLEKFVEGSRVKVCQMPFLAYKMNHMIEIVDRLMDSKFRLMCEEMESNLRGVRKVFKKEYFQGPNKPVRYLLTIAEVKKMCFKVFFSFRCLKKSYYFELESPGKYESSKTLGRAESMCELVKNDLISNDFQNRFKDKLEKFEEIRSSDHQDFKFRTGDCLLLPRGGFGNTPLFYHHVLFLGCPDSCKVPKKCSCLNIFHFTNDEIDSALIIGSMTAKEKAGFEYLNIKECLQCVEFLKVKRNQFLRLTKSQYHEKAIEYKKNLEKKFSGKERHSKGYNLLFNNCGHAVNSFENPSPDMGKDNRVRTQIAAGGVIGIAIALVSGIGYGIYKALDSSETENSSSDKR